MYKGFDFQKDHWILFRSNEKDIYGKVEEIIAAVGATSMADMGKVMGQASAAMAGQADGKVISGFVRKHLA